MKHTSYLFLCTVFMILMGMDSGLFAQGSGSGSIGTAIQYTRPTAQLADKGFKEGFGISMNILSRARFNNPVVGLQFGAQMDFECSGMSQDALLMPSPTTGELAEMNIENTQIGLHGIARVVTTDQFPVQVYADGMIGSRMFMAQESFEHIDDYDCPEVNTLNTNLVLSYGGSLGALVRVGRVITLDMRATYLTSSGPATFADLESVQQTEAGFYDFQYKRAPASQLRFQLGVNMPLSGMCGGW